tara:strand:- start:7 stop:1710 length:1704 start_codon:yes stop_codon:yes gene_type:complete
MSTRLVSFASELTKLSEEKDKERKGYGHRMIAAAPFAVASAAADVPKGWVDSSVEQRLRGVSKAQRASSLRKGLARGTGRLGAGLATSPIFLSGIQDLRSGDPERKKKGYAKIVSSGMAFGASKGAIEAAITSGGRDVGAIARKVKKLGTSRGIVGMGAAALTAASVAKATRKPKKGEKPKSTWSSYGAPAMTGAAIGAGKGAFDELIDKGSKATLRGVKASAGGRAAAGAIGAAALTGLVKKFTSDKKVKGRPGYRLVPGKKDPSKRRWQKIASEAPSDMYQDVSQWARKQNDQSVSGLMTDVAAGGMGERSQSRRSAYYALHDEMGRRGQQLPEPKMRSQVEHSSRVYAPSMLDKAAVAMLAVAPGAVAGALMTLEPTAKDLMLEDAVDRAFIQGRLRREVSPDYSIYPESKVVLLPEQGKALPGLVAHEVGHADPGMLRKATIGSDAAQIAMRAGAFASVAIPLAVLMSAGDGRYATKQELESKAKIISTVGTIAALAQAPGILEEVAANVKAVSVLRSVGDSNALARVIRQAGPGFATYLAPLLVPMAASRILRRRARAKEQS